VPLRGYFYSSSSPNFPLEDYHGTYWNFEGYGKMNTPSTSIRLDLEDIELAKKIAKDKGLKYQTYLKMIIHEELRKVSDG
jgi:hypothetical protein